MNDVDHIYLSRRDLLVLLNKLDRQFDVTNKDVPFIMKTKTDSDAYTPTIPLLKIIPVENKYYYAPPVPATPVFSKDFAAY